jgi:DNA-binding MarR family transcriptional regulator
MSQRGALLYGVLRHVRPLTLNSARVVEAGLQRHGLTVGMRAVLEVLDEHGPATVPQVAAILDLQRQGVQRLVNELKARGHVEQQPNPQHRRSVLIALTASGRRAFEAVRTQELAELATLAPDCSAAEIRTTEKVLAALSADVRRRALESRDPSQREETR